MEHTSVNTSPSRTRTSRKAQLDRDAWIETATDVLAKEGVSGLRIEVLAKVCGVTKGSFYWHFKDRQDLLASVLEHWRIGRLRDIEKATTAAPGQEQEKLGKLIDLYGYSNNVKGISIELAIRDWARHDALAAGIVEAVDLHRLECTRKLFVATGMPDAEAKSRSVLLYACVFGLSLMRYQGFGRDKTEFKGSITERIISK